MNINLQNISISNLFKLRDLSFKFGEKILIQGPSGKGKTTLLHILAGILPPHTGIVKFDTQSIYELNDNEISSFRKKNIGLIYQQLNLVAHLTATENIQLSKQASQQDAKKFLDLVNLPNKSEQLASTMSLGEQQRVAIARVLAQAPLIVLADEPTSSLDKGNTENIMNLLLKCSEGKTLVVVSHDNRIEKYFDRVIQFEDLIV